MKFYLFVILFLSSCTPKYSQIGNNSTKTLPYKEGVVTYYKKFYRANMDTAQANTRIRYWLNTHYTLFGLQTSKLAPNTSDLVYSGMVPARRFYNARAERITYPAINFNLTFANKADSSEIRITNFEVFDQQTRSPLETHRFSDRQFTVRWLTDLDTSMNDLMGSLTKQLDQKP